MQLRSCGVGQSYHAAHVLGSRESYPVYARGVGEPFHAAQIARSRTVIYATHVLGEQGIIFCYSNARGVGESVPAAHILGSQESPSVTLTRRVGEPFPAAQSWGIGQSFNEAHVLWSRESSSMTFTPEKQGSHFLQPTSWGVGSNLSLFLLLGVRQ